VKKLIFSHKKLSKTTAAGLSYLSLLKELFWHKFDPEKN